MRQHNATIATSSATLAAIHRYFDPAGSNPKGRNINVENGV